MERLRPTILAAASMPHSDMPECTCIKHPVIIRRWNGFTMLLLAVGYHRIHWKRSEETNLYQYVENDPVDEIDALGLMSGPRPGTAPYIPHPDNSPEAQRERQIVVTMFCMIPVVRSASIIRSIIVVTCRTLCTPKGDPSKKPPGWTEDWVWKYPESASKAAPRCLIQMAVSGVITPEDKYHNPHWDYNPWRHPSDPWQNVPIPPLPPRK